VRDKILTTYFEVDDLRWRSALDERIKFKEKAMAALEQEMWSCVHQIKANEEVAPNAEQSSFLARQLINKQAEWDGLRLELEALLYRRMLLEQKAEEMSRPARD
jgi:hypothetical protein